MKKAIISLSMAGLTSVAGVAVPVGAANAAAVCYASNTFPNERIVIDVEKQGALVNPWLDAIALIFGGKQTAYSAHGKHVWAAQQVEQGGGWAVATAAITGTVDVSAPYLFTQPNVNAMQPTATGAHMGLSAEWVTFYNEKKRNSWPVSLDCGSKEMSPTPDKWVCGVANELGYSFMNVVYAKVNMADDVRCNMFQATTPSDLSLIGSMTNIGK
ncbi:hypothetical protein [Methylococcus mesophilus]|uniref:hypothetical protein n=1 Tax=Methylococcus mesophilus TaxID=2993564 RepID=UPI00224AF44C|nr:hypothetical protein [Methylococcus mesophilus]UZR27241.1 hypothetical protein OOT43_10885 [Methylococcus mesophilus]